MAQGQLDGIVASKDDLVPLKESKGSFRYRAGYLGSRLMIDLIDSSEALPERTWPLASRYALALADMQGQAALARPAPRNLFSAHAYAWRQMTQAESSPGSVIERIMFRWLALALGVDLTAEQIAAVERRWRERDTAVGADREPQTSSGSSHAVAAIRVVLRAAGAAPAPTGTGLLSLAFGLPDEEWRVAWASRYDGATDPANAPEVWGFLEVMVGEEVILRRAPVSVFGAVCALARARAEGFPERKSVCVLDDSTGTWAIHLVRDPQQPRIQITETYTGASAYAPMKAVAELIDAFLLRFVQEASPRIPELTGWGEFELLARYSKQA